MDLPCRTLEVDEKQPNFCLEPEKRDHRNTKKLVCLFLHFKTAPTCWVLSNYFLCRIVTGSDGLCHGRHLSKHTFTIFTTLLIIPMNRRDEKASYIVQDLNLFSYTLERKNSMLVVYLTRKLQTRPRGIPIYNERESFNNRVIGSFRSPSIPMS
jgi:hypothetical protein